MHNVSDIGSVGPTRLAQKLDTFVQCTYAEVCKAHDSLDTSEHAEVWAYLVIRTYTVRDGGKLNVRNCAMELNEAAPRANLR